MAVFCHDCSDLYNSEVLMKRVIHPMSTSVGYPHYTAIIVVRQNIKGARREEHTYHAEDSADLWGHAIDFLEEGFSVISCDLYEVE